MFSSFLIEVNLGDFILKDDNILFIPLLPKTDTPDVGKIFNS